MLAVVPHVEPPVPEPVAAAPEPEPLPVAAIPRTRASAPLLHQGNLFDPPAKAAQDAGFRERAAGRAGDKRPRQLSLF